MFRKRFPFTNYNVSINYNKKDKELSASLSKTDIKRHNEIPEVTENFKFMIFFGPNIKNWLKPSIVKGKKNV